MYRPSRDTPGVIEILSGSHIHRQDLRFNPFEIVPPWILCQATGPYLVRYLPLQGYWAKVQVLEEGSLRVGEYDAELHQKCEALYGVSSRTC